jgi:hypothetical protein
MTKNQILRNKATGETLTMLVSEEENGGACQLYEVLLPPHRPGPPLHYHVDFIEARTWDPAGLVSRNERFEVSYQCHMNCDEWRQKVNKDRKEKVNLTTPIYGDSDEGDRGSGLMVISVPESNRSVVGAKRRWQLDFVESDHDRQACCC